MAVVPSHTEPQTTVGFPFPGQEHQRGSEKKGWIRRDDLETGDTGEQQVPRQTRQGRVASMSKSTKGGQLHQPGMWQHLEARGRPGGREVCLGGTVRVTWSSPDWQPNAWTSPGHSRKPRKSVKGEGTWLDG